jgi:hypothetical protein
MNGFEYGTKRAIEEIVCGFVTSVIVNVFINSGLLSPSYVLLFGVINVIGLITLIFAMPYWGITYLLGWLFGVIIMLQSGLIGILEVIIYLGIPLVVLILRVKSWFEGE